MRNEIQGAIARHAKRLWWCLSQPEAWSMETFRNRFGMTLQGSYWWLRVIASIGLIARQTKHPHVGNPQMYKRLFKIEKITETKPTFYVDMTPCEKHGIFPCGVCHNADICNKKNRA